MDTVFQSTLWQSYSRAETLFKTNATLYYRSFEIARHTSPSGAQYLKINLLWRTVITSSMGSTPKYLQISLKFSVLYVDTYKQNAIKSKF